MASVTKKLTKKEERDIRTLAKFVAIHCRLRHTVEGTKFNFQAKGLGDFFKKAPVLCPDCSKLLKYAITMRLRCPHEPKPVCRKCPDHCYKPEYREKIREVMKFSGMHMIKRGRIDLLYHYFR